MTSKEKTRQRNNMRDQHRTHPMNRKRKVQATSWCRAYGEMPEKSARNMSHRDGVHEIAQIDVEYQNQSVKALCSQLF